MLLTDSLNHMSESHPRYEQLRDAVKTIQEFAQFVAEAQKDAENREKMRQLSSRLQGLPSTFRFLEPHRRLVREATVTVQVPGEPRPCTRTLLLCNDVLLVCKTRTLYPDMLWCHDPVQPHRMHVSDVDKAGMSPLALR